ncbi:MAG: hypothetical protein ACOX3F_10235, partial [Kiritimatiellia bacterium]
GTGMLASYFVVSLKWELRKPDVHVRLGGEFNNKELIFSWGTSPDSIQTIWLDGKIHVFHRVNTSEPPNLVALTRKTREKAWQESRKLYNTYTNVACSLADIPVCTEDFMLPSPLVSHLTLAVDGTNIILTMQRAGTSTHLRVTAKYAGERPHDFSTTGAWAASPPTNTWPEVVLIEDSAISELNIWLAARGMAITSDYCIYRDEWELRGYEQIIHIHIPLDAHVMDTLHYVLASTLHKFPPPYTLIISIPKPTEQPAPDPTPQDPRRAAFAPTAGPGTD